MDEMELGETGWIPKGNKIWNSKTQTFEEFEDDIDNNNENSSEEDNKT